MIQFVPHGEQNMLLLERSLVVCFNNRVENINAQYGYNSEYLGLNLAESVVISRLLSHFRNLGLVF
jgi:hypothetical protein